MPKEAPSLTVPKTLGQKTLDLANKLGLTEKRLQIQKDENGNLSIPLNREPTENEAAELKRQVPQAQLTTNAFPEKRQQEKTLAELLVNQLPSNLLDSLPRALDIVGDIAIIEVPPELEPHKAVVGAAILQVHRSVQVVLAKAGKVSGTFRLREFEFLAGEKRTRTLYKEHGCSYYVDMAKAYFSPRLSNEHQRVAELVREGETVVDLFAGVGPFAVPIAKNCKTAQVYAIDINADAVELLKQNIQLNKVEAQVYPIVGDARQVVDEKLVGVADRVIMNLPETADEFIDVACRAVKSDGGVIHFYGFVRMPDTVEKFKQLFAEGVTKAGRKVVEFGCVKTVRETAPYEWQAVLDAQIR